MISHPLVRFEWSISSKSYYVFGQLDFTWIPANAPPLELRCPDPKGLTGEKIYSYVDVDDFADRREAEKTVTTSPSEPLNPLARAVFGSPRARQAAEKVSGREARALRAQLAQGRRRRAGAHGVHFDIAADCGALQLPPEHPAVRRCRLTSG